MRKKEILILACPGFVVAPLDDGDETVSKKSQRSAICGFHFFKLGERQVNVLPGVYLQKAEKSACGG